MGGDLVGEDHEQQCEDAGAPALQPVDELVAQITDQTLQSQDHQHADSKGHVEEDLSRLATEQADQTVPGHGGHPLDEGGDGDRLPER